MRHKDGGAKGKLDNNVLMIGMVAVEEVVLKQKMQKAMQMVLELLMMGVSDRTILVMVVKKLVKLIV